MNEMDYLRKQTCTLSSPESMRAVAIAMYNQGLWSRYLRWNDISVVSDFMRSSPSWAKFIRGEEQVASTHSKRMMLLSMRVRAAITDFLLAFSSPSSADASLTLFDGPKTCCESEIGSLEECLRGLSISSPLTTHASSHPYLNISAESTHAANQERRTFPLQYLYGTLLDQDEKEFKHVEEMDMVSRVYKIAIMYGYRNKRLNSIVIGIMTWIQNMPCQLNYHPFLV